MEKTFIFHNISYTVRTCTAIAASIGDTERQNALLVTSRNNGEKAEFVVFGWEMPEDDETFAEMCEDTYAWDSNHETLETVEK